MATESATLVLFNLNDVAAAPLTGFNNAIAMSPSAYSAAIKMGIHAEQTLSFSDIDHARCAAAARITLRNFDGALGVIQLPPSVELMARQALWNLACLVFRLDRTFHSGVWLVKNDEGVWIKTKNREDVQRILLPRIWEYGLAHHVEAKRPFLQGVYRLISRFVASFIARKGSAFVAASSRKLRYGFHESLVNAGGCMVVFQMTTGGWADYSHLINSLFRKKNILLFPIAPVSRDSKRLAHISNTLNHLDAFISDTRVRFAWDLYKQRFMQIVPSMLGFAEEGQVLMRLLKVRAAVAYEANSWLPASLLEAAGAANIPRVTFNHNSQPPSGKAIADSILGTLFCHRTCNKLVDIAVLWSPASEQWMIEHDNGHTQTQKYQVSLEYPVSTRLTGSSRTFRILHAGNYQNWSDFFPWIAETADEYIAGMESFATAVESFDDVEVVFRVRPKREVDAKTVEARLGKYPNVKICTSDIDFLEQLAEFDLLVSHFSTTVEQALQMGKPVLLWGNSNRYQQFSGQEFPPSDRSRSAVYIVRRSEDLHAMIAGIRNAHHARPLQDNEYKQYRFGPGTLGVDALAIQLLTSEVFDKQTS